MGSRLGAREKTGWVYIIYSYRSYQSTKHMYSYNILVTLLACPPLPHPRGDHRTVCTGVSGALVIILQPPQLVRVDASHD